MTLSLVQTVTVGAGGAASIEFTGIPQTGTDLLVMVSGRTSDSSRIIKANFNSDTGANYTRRVFFGDGSTVSNVGLTGQATLFVSNGLPNSTDTASTFGNASFYIPNYASANTKSVSIDAVSENNGTQAFQIVEAGSWSGTAAITSVALYVNSGTFAQYSTASLYIITKGSGGATVS